VPANKNSEKLPPRGFDVKNPIIAAAVAFSLAACGNHNSAPITQPTAASENPAHHRFAVGLGSFPDDASAQAWIDKLKAVGVPAYIETVTQAGNPTVTELRGGPFDSSADASAAIAKIRAAGFSPDAASPASAPDTGSGVATATAASTPAPASAPADSERLKQCEDVRDVAQFYGDELVRGHERKELLKQYGAKDADVKLINFVAERMNDGTTTVQQAMDAAYNECMSTASAPAISGIEPMQTYVDQVRRRVRPNIVWDGPSSGLETEIAVHCAPSGTLLSATIRRSSGNAQWDDAALEAVKHSDPMPLDTDGHAPTTFAITVRPAG
jgi:TonB family protein